MLQAVLEERAIGKTAQPVVESLMLEFLLETLALGDIPHREDDAFDGRVAQEVRRDHFDVAPRSVPVLDTPFGISRCPCPKGNPRIRGQGLFDVVDVEKRGKAPALEGPWRIAKNPRGRGRLVHDRGIWTGNQDHVRRVLYQRLEAGFAPTRMNGLGHRLTIERQFHLWGKDLDRAPEFGR